jgi:hypothetical protein
MSRYCSVECPSEQWSCSGRVRDVSDGGMGVQVLAEPGMKEEINLYMLDEEGQELVRRGVVAWSRKQAFPRVGAVVGLRLVN